MMRHFALLFLLASIANSAPTEELGRVFLSPDERRDLDKQRKQFYSPPVVEPIVEIPIIQQPESEAVEQPVGPNLVINGYVKRSGTSGTVWINGETTYDGDVGSLQVDHRKTQIMGKQVKVAPINQADAIFLKPGQRFDRQRNEIVDLYESAAPENYLEPSPQQ